jgi:hypothetical protein
MEAPKDLKDTIAAMKKAQEAFVEAPPKHPFWHWIFTKSVSALNWNGRDVKLLHCSKCNVSWGIK